MVSLGLNELSSISSMFGLMLLFHATLRIPTAWVFLFTPTFIICVLFLAARLDILTLTRESIQILGNLYFFYILIISNFNVSKSPIYKIQIEFKFFFAGSIALFLLTRLPQYDVLLSFDDLSHWARTTRLIDINQRLINTTDPIGVKSYPPGIALFQYYFGFPFTTTHKSMFYSQSIFVLSILTPVAVIARDRNVFRLISSSIFVFIILGTFNVAFHSLNADIWVASLWSATLVIYHINRKSFVVLFCLCPIVISLLLFKEIGAFFSVVIVAYIAYDNLTQTWSRARLRRNFFVLGAVSALTLLTQTWWLNHSASLQEIPVFPIKQSFSAILNSFIYPSVVQGQIITEFFKRLLPIYIDSDDRLTCGYFFYIITILLCLTYLIFQHKCTTSTTDRRFLLAIYIIFFTYLVAHLYLYLYSFGKYEAVKMASFDRYINILFVGLFVIIYGINAHLAKYKSSQATLSLVSVNEPINVYFLLICIFSIYKAWAIIFPLFFVLIFSISKHRFPIFYRLRFNILAGVVITLALGAAAWRLVMVDRFASTNPSLLTINNRASAVLTYIGTTSKTPIVYSIFQDSNGQDYHQFTYNILPLKSNIRCWSIGQSYGSHDSWTCPSDFDKWGMELALYDFVFLGKADKQFNDQFSSLFIDSPPEEGNLYKVVVSNGSTKLHRVLMQGDK